MIERPLSEPINHSTMKRKNLFYAFLAFFVTLSAISISVYSCEKESIAPGDNQLMKFENLQEPELPTGPAICGSYQERDLIQEDGTTVGRAYTYNNTKYMFITVITNKGFYMNDLSANVSKRFEDIPRDDQGNPIVRLFNHMIDGNVLSNIRIMRISLDEMTSTSIITVVAQVRQQVYNNQFPVKTKRAWIDGREYGTTIVGRVFTYNKGICLTNDAVSVPD
jgi:hypothetical protein